MLFTTPFAEIRHDRAEEINPCKLVDMGRMCAIQLQIEREIH